MITNDIKQNYRFSYDAPFSISIEQMEKIFDYLDKASVALTQNIADYKKEVEAKARKLYGSDIYSESERDKKISEYYECKRSTGKTSTVLPG